MQILLVPSPCQRTRPHFLCTVGCPCVPGCSAQINTTLAIVFKTRDWQLEQAVGAAVEKLQAHVSRPLFLTGVKLPADLKVACTLLATQSFLLAL